MVRIILIISFMSMSYSQPCEICMNGTFSDTGCRIESVKTKEERFTWYAQRRNKCPIMSNSNGHFICQERYVQGIGLFFEWVKFQSLYVSTSDIYGYTELKDYNVQCLIATNYESGTRSSSSYFPNCIFSKDFDWGCVDCYYGKYTNASGLTSCLSCNEGKFASALGRTKCDDCLPGYGSNSGAEICSACLPGKYSLLGTSCMSCGFNRYCSGGLNHRQDCPNSTLTLYANSTSVQDCCSR